MSVQLFPVLLVRDEYIQYLRDAWSQIDCLPHGSWFSFWHLHVPSVLFSSLISCCALFLFNFAALGRHRSFPCCWGRGKLSFPAFSSMFVHVCHLFPWIDADWFVAWRQTSCLRVCVCREGDGLPWCAEVDGVRTPRLAALRFHPGHSQPDRAGWRWSPRPERCRCTAEIPEPTGDLNNLCSVPFPSRRKTSACTGLLFLAVLT